MAYTKVYLTDEGKAHYLAADLHPATDGSAGLDLKIMRQPRSAMELAKAGSAWPYNDLVPTGVSVEIPPGWVGLLIPRSSAGHKHGMKLGNTMGVIDSDYRGEIMLSIEGGRLHDLKAGQAVAQLVVVPVLTAFSLESGPMTETERGAGGFGSTDHQDVPVEKDDPGPKGVSDYLKE